MVEKGSQADSGSSTLGPGSRLKEARLAQGLSVKDISSRLNLKTEIVEAMENGQDEKLPVSTYVRGYIRSYAKILNLDSNELISLYENSPISPPEIIPDVRTSSQVSSRDKPVKAFTYLVTFILALLLIAWLQGNYVIQPEIPDTVNNTPDSFDVMQEENGTIEAPQQPENTVYYYPGINLDDYSPESRRANQIEDEKDISVSGIELLELGEFQEEEIQPADEANRNTTSSVANDSLKLILYGESWIEVSDASSNKLYTGIAKAGEEIQLAGTAPFTVLLGYSPAVEVIFNGENFNTEPYSDGSIARFTLGE